MKKILKKILKRKFTVSFIIIILIVLGYMFFGGNGDVVDNFALAEKRNIIQEVYVTGRVKPAESFDLAFERSGKVAVTYVVVGEKVAKGKTLAALENSDIRLQIAQAKDNLDSAIVALEKLKEPSEAIDILEAENALLKANEDKENAQSDLEKSYEDGFNTVADAFSDLPSIMAGLEDMLFDDEVDGVSGGQNNIDWYANQTSFEDDARSKALDLKNSVREDYNAARKAYENSFDNYKVTSRYSSPEVIEALVSEVYDTTKVVADAVKTIDNYIDFVEDDMEKHDQTIISGITSDQSTISSYVSDTSGHLIALLDIEDAIKEGKEDILNADRDIAEKTQTLNDLKDGTDELDIRAQEIVVRQKENALAEARTLLSKTIIYSPIDGVITKQDAKTGEIISANSTVISLLSDSNFEIEVNVPEADIAKLREGNEASITLDAYGRNVEFAASIVNIDPAETLLEGVATYKTTLQFINEDERIRSGMTAKITVSTDNRENVIAIPQRSIALKDGKLFVKILEGDAQREVEVKTGLRGSDGYVEVLEGLNEGDKVVTISSN